MKLFIVESPSKCPKLRSYLGDGFKVTASMGHVREIPADSMNIDIPGGFIPTFQISASKKDVVAEIRSLAKEADEIFLATDPDREGESISQHLYDLLDKTSQKKCCRVTFQEITKKAVAEALKHPRKIDDNLVNAQKARQVLDRLIGYTASPTLWKTVGRGTSAGRVQSIALRLICERQAEIDAFKPIDFWYVDAELHCQKGNFTARVVADEKEVKTTEDPTEKSEKEEEKQLGRFRFLKEKVAKDALEALKTANYILDKVERKEKFVKPMPPFDTTSMQTACSSALGWDATRTMKIAQSLYESGHVTYIRSDSYNIAEEAIAEVRSFIKSQHGDKYLPAKAHTYEKKSSAAAQEAHECIRPTHVEETLPGLNGDDKDLYELIRERFIACQMAPLIMDMVVYHVKTSSKHKLLAKGQAVRFDGWTKVYRLREAKDEILPNAEEKEKLDLKGLECTKHSTKPPERYNDGSLVKKMESEGVGRPATRAKIIKNIEDKGYVSKDKKAFVPTDLGKRICSFLTPAFIDHFMDIKFTAGLEEDIDLIAHGKKQYAEVIQPVYDSLKNKVKGIDPKALRAPSVSTGKKCTACKSGEIVEKEGKFGKFYCCNAYPDCKTVYLLDNGDFKVKKAGEVKETGERCQRCSKGKIVEKKGQYGTFLACNNYPACKTIYLQDSKGEYVVK